MLSVHGHIHESRAVKKMGRTLAINPGSVYGDGVLQGAVIDLNAKKGKVAKIPAGQRLTTGVVTEHQRRYSIGLAGP